MKRSKLLTILKKDKNNPHQIAFDSRIFLNKTCNELKVDFELIEEIRQINKIHYSHNYSKLKNTLQKAYNKYIQYTLNELKQKEINLFQQ